MRRRPRRKTERKEVICEKCYKVTIPTSDSKLSMCRCTSSQPTRLSPKQNQSSASSDSDSAETRHPQKAWSFKSLVTKMKTVPSGQRSLPLSGENAATVPTKRSPDTGLDSATETVESETLVPSNECRVTQTAQISSALCSPGNVPLHSTAASPKGITESSTDTMPDNMASSVVSPEMLTKITTLQASSPVKLSENVTENMSSGNVAPKDKAAEATRHTAALPQNASLASVADISAEKTASGNISPEKSVEISSLEQMYPAASPQTSSLEEKDSHGHTVSESSSESGSKDSSSKAKDPHGYKACDSPSKSGSGDSMHGYTACESSLGSGSENSTLQDKMLTTNTRQEDKVITDTSSVVNIQHMMEEQNKASIISVPANTASPADVSHSVVSPMEPATQDSTQEKAFLHGTSAERSRLNEKIIDFDDKQFSPIKTKVDIQSNDADTQQSTRAHIQFNVGGPYAFPKIKTSSPADDGIEVDVQRCQRNQARSVDVDYSDPEVVDQTNQTVSACEAFHAEDNSKDEGDDPFSDDERSPTKWIDLSKKDVDTLHSELESLLDEVHCLQKGLEDQIKDRADSLADTQMKLQKLCRLQIQKKRPMDLTGSAGNPVAANMMGLTDKEILATKEDFRNSLIKLGDVEDKLGECLHVIRSCKEFGHVLKQGWHVTESVTSDGSVDNDTRDQCQKSHFYWSQLEKGCKYAGLGPSPRGSDGREFLKHESYGREETGSVCRVKGTDIEQFYRNKHYFRSKSLQIEHYKSQLSSSTLHQTDSSYTELKELMLPPERQTDDERNANVPRCHVDVKSSLPENVDKADETLSAFETLNAEDESKSKDRCGDKRYPTRWIDLSEKNTAIIHSNQRLRQMKLQTLCKLHIPKRQPKILSDNEDDPVAVKILGLTDREILGTEDDLKNSLINKLVEDISPTKLEVPLLSEIARKAVLPKKRPLCSGSSGKMDTKQLIVPLGQSPMKKCCVSYASYPSLEECSKKLSDPENVKKMKQLLTTFANIETGAYQKYVAKRPHPDHKVGNTTDADELMAKKACFIERNPETYKQHSGQTEQTVTSGLQPGQSKSGGRHFRSPTQEIEDVNRDWMMSQHGSHAKMTEYISYPIPLKYQKTSNTFQSGIPYPHGKSAPTDKHEHGPSAMAEHDKEKNTAETYPEKALGGQTTVSRKSTQLLEDHPDENNAQPVRSASSDRTAVEGTSERLQHCQPQGEASPQGKSPALPDTRTVRIPTRASSRRKDDTHQKSQQAQARRRAGSPTYVNFDDPDSYVIELHVHCFNNNKSNQTGKDQGDKQNENDSAKPSEAQQPRDADKKSKGNVAERSDKDKDETSPVDPILQKLGDRVYDLSLKQPNTNTGDPFQPQEPVKREENNDTTLPETPTTPMETCVDSGLEGHDHEMSLPAEADSPVRAKNSLHKTKDETLQEEPSNSPNRHHDKSPEITTYTFKGHIEPTDSSPSSEEDSSSPDDPRNFTKYSYLVRQVEYAREEARKCRENGCRCYSRNAPDQDPPDTTPKHTPPKPQQKELTIEDYDKFFNYRTEKTEVEDFYKRQKWVKADYHDFLIQTGLAEHDPELGPLYKRLPDPIAKYMLDALVQSKVDQVGNIPRVPIPTRVHRRAIPTGPTPTEQTFLPDAAAVNAPIPGISKPITKLLGDPSSRVCQPVGLQAEAEPDSIPFGADPYRLGGPEHRADYSTRFGAASSASSSDESSDCDTSPHDERHQNLLRDEKRTGITCSEMIQMTTWQYDSLFMNWRKLRKNPGHIATLAQEIGLSVETVQVPWMDYHCHNRGF